MTITVNNVQLTVDEDMLPLLDGDEVAAFAPFGANATLIAAVNAIAANAAAPTADFTTTQIASQDGFFTIGENTTTVSFVASNGTPPATFPTASPGIDSGLKAADGTSIYLFQSATTNDVIYGTIGDNPNGPVAFTLVIDEQFSGANVTNAKLWVIQYAALLHDGQNVTEGDLLDLTGKVFVASSSFVESVFSDFSDVASGAPVFAMIADDTGDSPIDFLVTAFATGAPNTLTTLNISSQGSFPGSLASGSQNITPGTGLRFDTVTNGVNVADKNDALISYGTHANVVQAGFTIVQNQGARPTDIKVQLFDSLSDTAQGHNFTTALANQSALGIDRVVVTVIDALGQVSQTITDTTSSNAFVTFDADRNVTVKDMQLNWTVQVYRAAGFDRFTATNVDSQGNAYVDIGRLTFTSSQTFADVDEVGSKIEFDDSGPTLQLDGAAAPLTVDDSDLPGGTTPDTPVTDSINVAGNFDFTYGSDGPGTFTYAMKAEAGDSGLDDAASGQNIFLRVNGSGVVEGYTETDEDIVFTVAVASNGDVTLTLLRAIKHDAAGGGDTSKTLAAAKIQVTGTVTDKEGATTGDSLSVDLPIGDKLNFLDDDPSVEATDAAADLLSADDDALGAPGDTESFAGLFDKVYGADGPHGTDDVVYSLVLSGPNSGIYDVKTGAEVLLKVVDGAVIGYVDDGGEKTVFSIAVNVDTGAVTFIQNRAVRHTDQGTPDDDSADPTHLAGTDLIGLVATIKDKDGDTASDTADITGTFVFNDGQPSITAVDATANTLNADDDALGAGGADTISGAALFTPNPGPDGYDATDDILYALSTPGGPSGIFDVATDTEVQLKVVGGEIIGYVDDGGEQTVFKVSVNSDTGLVTLTQLRAIRHDDTPPADDDSPDPEHLASADLIQLTATIKDKDGDTDTATSNIGGALEFTDGQPTIEATDAEAGSLATDDDDLATSASDTISGAALFTPNYGPDGAAAGDAVTYGLEAPAAASGVYDVATNLEVQLKTESGVVIGYVDDGGTERTVFTVGVDTDTGVVTLTQLRAIRHTDTPPADDDSADPTGLTGTDKIKLVATITDKDGDTARGVADLTPAIRFTDGQPSITAEDATLATLIADDDTLGGAGVSSDLSGLFDPDFGPDGPHADDVVYSLSSYTGLIDVFDVQTDLQLSLKTVAGVVTGYIDDGGTEKTVFTLTVNADTGEVTLTQQRAIRHTDGGVPTNDPIVLVGDDLVSLTATIKDKDGDTAAATADITVTLQFNDAQPELEDPADLNIKFADGETETVPFVSDFNNDNDGTVTIDSYTYTGPYTVTEVGDNRLNFSDGAKLVYHVVVGNDGYTVVVDDVTEPTSTPLDFNAIKAGGPQEILTVPLVGGGDSIVFDGLLNGAQAAGDGDYLNPDSVGFGIKNNQASQINPGESFTFHALSGNKLSSLDFDIQGIGGIKTVRANWELWDDGADNIRGNGDDVLLDSGTANFPSLPSGNNVVHVEVVDDGAASQSTTSGAGNAIAGQDFDYGIVSFVFPANSKGVVSDNQGIRVLNFATTETTVLDPDQFTMTLIATDGDGDTTTSGPITVYLDPTFV